MITTIKHNEIRNWVTKYKGKPELIDDQDAAGDKVGIRINFPGKIDDALISDDKTIEASWKRFFEIFDKNSLAFQYDPKPKAQDLSLAYRFINRAELENKLPQL